MLNSTAKPNAAVGRERSWDSGGGDKGEIVMRGRSGKTGAENFGHLLICLPALALHTAGSDTSGPTERPGGSKP